LIQDLSRNRKESFKLENPDRDMANLFNVNFGHLYAFVVVMTLQCVGVLIALSMMTYITIKVSRY